MIVSLAGTLNLVVMLELTRVANTINAFNRDRSSTIQAMLMEDKLVSSTAVAYKGSYILMMG